MRLRKHLITSMQNYLLQDTLKLSKVNDKNNFKGSQGGKRQQPTKVPP